MNSENFEEELFRVIDRGNFSISKTIDIIENRIKNRAEKAKRDEERVLIVDYKKSLAEMIVAGNYDNVDDWITDQTYMRQETGDGSFYPDVIEKHTFLSAELNKEKFALSFAKLFNFPSYPKIKIIREMERQGYRQAILPELLAFGATFPTLQMYYPILTFGSIWRDFNYHFFVVRLDSSPYQSYGPSQKKTLELDSFASDEIFWEKIRFLGIRK